MNEQRTTDDKSSKESIFEVRFEKGILNEEQTAAIEKAIQAVVLQQVALLKLPAKPLPETEMFGRETRGMWMA